MYKWLNSQAKSDDWKLCAAQKIQAGSARIEFLYQIRFLHHLGGGVAAVGPSFFAHSSEKRWQLRQSLWPSFPPF